MGAEPAVEAADAGGLDGVVLGAEALGCATDVVEKEVVAKSASKLTRRPLWLAL